MIVGHKVAVVNPRRIRAPGHEVRSSSNNPAYAMTLGLINPKRSNMAKHRKKNHARGHHHRVHRRSGNPFARQISLNTPSNMVVAGLGALVGVAATKTLVGFLPSSISGNTLYATIGAFVAAAAQWWAFSMINPEFGAAAGLGGIAEAGSIALTNYFPTVGGYIALGDFVSGRFSVPQNPVLDAATALPMRTAKSVGAYPSAYLTAA